MCPSARSGRRRLSRRCRTHDGPLYRRPRRRDCGRGSSQPAARARRLRRSFSAHGLDVARRADPRGHVCRARRPGGAGHRSAQLTVVREPVPFRIRLGRSALFCCQHLAEPAALSCLARPIAFTAVVVVPASAGDVEPARCELDGRTIRLPVDWGDVAVCTCRTSHSRNGGICDSCCRPFRRCWS